MLAAWVLTIIALGHVALAENPSVTPDVLTMLRATGQDETLAELMGIEDVSLLRANEERSDDPLLGSNVSPLGDILLTREQSEQARQGLNFYKYIGSKWRNNVLPYWVDTNDFTSDQQTEIHTAIEKLNNRLRNLTIRRWQSGDEDYVWIFNGNGCWSYLGTVGGGQGLSLQKNGCVFSGTIQHEIIHAIGFQHEHNRPDRDNHVRVRTENIPAEWQSQYGKASCDDYILLGKYDHYSVMHYPYNAPGTNNPAFEVYDKSINTNWMGQDSGFTPTDLEKIDKLYM